MNIKYRIELDRYMDKFGWVSVTNAKFMITAVLMVAVLSLPSMIYTGSYIISDAPAPETGVELPPEGNEKLSDGLLFIVLDGGVKHLMDDKELMPTLHSKKRSGTYIEVLSNPLTMTASCVKEMATGIPSRPNEGLNNFHPKHPGTPDGWTVASEYDGDNDGVYDYRVGIVGDYVWGDLYSDNEKINFMKHRYGHADFYQGDTESFETLNSWLEGDVPKSNTKPGVTYEEPPNIIIAHLSGLDSVGHRYGVKNSAEYEEKLVWLDDKFATVFENVPDSWTVIVTSDHGLTDSGQHGSPDLEIRQVGAWMWGPYIKENYIYPEEIDQRDFATIPSLLFSLPLPHAVHGKFPIDALTISDERKQSLDQWNWNSTISRNEWMKENEHSYFPDITREVIEWEKISYEEMGMRVNDLILSAFFFTGVVLFAHLFMKRKNIDKKTNIIATTTLATTFLISALIAYNRETIEIFYIMIGYCTPLVFAGLSLTLLLSDRFSNAARGKMTVAAMVCFLIMIIFPESRLSALNILFLIMLATPIFLKRKSDKKTGNLLLACFTLAVIPTTILSHYRVFYFSFPRGAINFSVMGDVLPLIMNTVLITLGILVYMTTNKAIKNKNIRYIIIGFFAAIPFLMYQENNTIDWIILTAMIVAVISGIYLKVKALDRGYEIITLTTFCWLTMSWGGYVGGISIVLFISIRSFINNELEFLKTKQSDMTKEIPRIMLVTIVPLVAWFLWWAALGQLGGFYHPRDVDPGSLYLNGGYIGDRFSPSNAWVGFMGGGPAGAMSLLWFSMFASNGYNMKYVALYLTARIAMLSFQLSLTPNLPRLIFKISWDIIFSLGLLAFMIHLVIQSRIEKTIDGELIIQTQ